MPVDLEALERELDNTTTIDPDKPTETKVDRGDELPEDTAKADRGDKVETVVETKDEDDDQAPAKKDPPQTDDKKADDKGEKAEEDDRERDEKGRFIPKGRFDEAVRKERARADAAEAALREALESVKGDDSKDVDAIESEIDTLTTKYHELLSEGKLDEARPILRDIRKLDREVVRLQVLPKAHESAAAQTRVQALTAVVELYKSEYPVFDEASKDFNQDVVNWVAWQQGVYQNAGIAPAVALQEAADLAIVKFGLKPVGARQDAPKKPTKAEKDAERTQEGVQKKLRVKQPADLSDVGTDSDKAGLTKINPLELSMEDFEKLGESEKKRLRGDIV